MYNKEINKSYKNETIHINTSKRQVGNQILTEASSKLSYQNQDDSEESAHQIEVTYPTLDDVMAHHEEALSLHGGKPGILGNGEDKIKAAIGRMQSGFGDAEFYPSLIEKAAILAHSIITTHPFSDANKRTAFLSIAYFLANHGITWDTDAEDLAEIIINVASNENNYEDILNWLQQNTRDMTDEEWETHTREENSKSEENPDAIKKLTWVDLPNAEQYESATSIYDPSPKEIVDAMPSRKKENNDPLRKRLDFNYEKDIFEKGLHQQDTFENPNINRPITPYGSSMCVEKASVEDAKELTKLSTRVFNEVSKEYHIDPPGGYDSVKEIQKTCKAGTCFKLIKNNEIIGGALIEYHNKEFYLDRLFISPEFQGQGLGKFFVHKIENQFPDATKFGTNTPAAMKHNIDFYKSLGYIPIGERTSREPKLIYFSKSKQRK